MLIRVKYQNSQCVLIWLNHCIPDGLFTKPDWPGPISSHTERCIKTTRQVSSCLVAWEASISTFSQLISLQTVIRNHAKVAVIGGLGERQMLRVTLTYITPFLISENYARHRVGLQIRKLQACTCAKTTYMYVLAQAAPGIGPLIFYAVAALHICLNRFRKRRLCAIMKQNADAEAV